MPQAIKRVAHRRLAKSNSPARSEDAPLLHHRIEDAEQVQVEIREIHPVHCCTAAFSLQALLGAAQLSKAQARRGRASGVALRTRSRRVFLSSVERLNRV